MRLPPTLAHAWGLVADTTSQFATDKCPRLAAALAYYTLFALVPLLVVAIAIAALVMGHEAARDAVLAQMRSLVGAEGASLMGDALDAVRRDGHGPWAAAIGGAGLLLGASGVFAELQGSLNTIWGLQAPKSKPILRLLRERFLSLTMVLGLGFLLLVSLAMDAAVAGLADWAGVAWVEPVVLVLDLAVSLIAVTVLLAAIYKVLPDARIRWREVWLGAFLTAVLLEAGQSAIGLYLGKGTVGSAFGAAGALAVLLAWVYYAGLIFFWGAEFTEVHADRQGAVEPRRGAVRVEPRRVPQRSSRRPARPPKASKG